MNEDNIATKAAVDLNPETRKANKEYELKKWVDIADRQQQEMETLEDVNSHLIDSLESVLLLAGNEDPFDSQSIMVVAYHVALKARKMHGKTSERSLTMRKTAHPAT